MNLGWPHTRQEPSPLCCHSHPDTPLWPLIILPRLAGDLSVRTGCPCDLPPLPSPLQTCTPPQWAGVLSNLSPFSAPSTGPFPGLCQAPQPVQPPPVPPPRTLHRTLPKPPLSRVQGGLELQQHELSAIQEAESSTLPGTTGGTGSASAVGGGFGDEGVLRAHS